MEKTEYKITLSDVMSRINMMLNYPAITYEDVSAFFDMAIADLNTTLHVDIKSFTNMIKEFRHYMSNNNENRVVITSEPDEATLIPDAESEAEATTNKYKYYYNTDLKMYGILKSKQYFYYNNLFGVHNKKGRPQFYKALRYSAEGSFWVLQDLDNPLDLNVLEYLAEDWVVMYLIPYVCFKYTCRDGGTASTFAEEFTQGFQQLQDAYDVQEYVNLATYADKIAYREDVENSLPNLNVKVTTKAIYKTMKHRRQVNAIYGNMYDRGGWL